MNQIRRRLIQLIIPMLAMLLLVYTAYQLLNGEKGIYTWKLVSQQVASLKSDIVGLQAEVGLLQHQVARLKPPMDNDFMDETVRRSLPVGAVGEIVILTSPTGYGGRVSITVKEK